MFLRNALISLIVACILCGAVFAKSERDHPRPKLRRGANPIKHPEEGSQGYWNKNAQETLSAKLQESDNVRINQAKNIIMFLGDGMSIHTVTAARGLLGDSNQQISFEKFPYLGLSKTYCVDRQVPDSACTATAYLGGVKGNYGTIGVNAKVPRYDCTAATHSENYVDSIAKWAQDAGKDAGLVTTARVTHASPAGVYAHTADRNWENDAEVLKKNCSPVENVDIARQLIEWPVGQKLKVIMGGGRRNFRNTTVNDEEGIHGKRTDGRDLIHEWLEQKRERNEVGEYVWSRKGLSMVDIEKTDYLMGLFSSSHCPYHGDLKRGRLEYADPSLSEMTEAAIKILSKNKNGFFLFVEGARIDMAHHDTRARKSLEDTVEFAKAVQVAKEMTSEDDTLIVVTSDHSHTMTINGYPYRDSEITGLSDDIADDGLPYTILSYANGPGFYNTYSVDSANGRSEVTPEQTKNAGFEYMASVPLESETHGGDDVGVFVSGNLQNVEMFSGNYEQSYIPLMMAKVANIGPYANNA